jgi:uncharacterized protein YukE
MGDPTAVRAIAQRLRGAATALRNAASLHDAADQDTAQVWSGRAQQVFSLLAGGYASLHRKTAELLDEFAQSLDRHASVLAWSQAEIRQAQRQLRELEATSRVGVPVDPATVAALHRRIADAEHRLDHSGRELTALARRIGGAPGTNGGPHAAGRNVQTSFVSTAHGAGLAASHPAGGVDVDAARVRDQLRGIFTSLTHHHSRHIPLAVTALRFPEPTTVAIRIPMEPTTTTPQHSIPIPVRVPVYPRPQGTTSSSTAGLRALWEDVFGQDAGTRADDAMLKDLMAAPMTTAQEAELDRVATSMIEGRLEQNALTNAMDSAHQRQQEQLEREAERLAERRGLDNQAWERRTGMDWDGDGFVGVYRPEYSAFDYLSFESNWPLAGLFPVALG